MWDLIVLLPDHCLSFYFGSCVYSSFYKGNESRYFTVFTVPFITVMKVEIGGYIYSSFSNGNESRYWLLYLQFLL